MAIYPVIADSIKNLLDDEGEIRDENPVYENNREFTIDRSEFIPWNGNSRFDFTCSKLADRHRKTNERFAKFTSADILACIKFEDSSQETNSGSNNKRSRRMQFSTGASISLDNLIQCTSDHQIDTRSAETGQDHDCKAFPDSNLIYTSPNKHNSLAAHLEQNSNTPSPRRTKSPWKNNANSSISFFDNPFHLKWPFDDFPEFNSRETFSGPGKHELLPETFNCLIESDCPTKFTNQYLQTYRSYLHDLVSGATDRSISEATLIGESEVDSHCTYPRLPSFVGKSRESKDLWDKLETTKTLWSTNSENTISEPENYKYNDANVVYSVPILNPRRSPLKRLSCRRKASDDPCENNGQDINKTSVQIRTHYRPTIIKNKNADIRKQNELDKTSTTPTNPSKDNSYAALESPSSHQNFALGDAPMLHQSYAKRKQPADEYRLITKTNEWTTERQPEHLLDGKTTPADKNCKNVEKSPSPKKVSRTEPYRHDTTRQYQEQTLQQTHTGNSHPIFTTKNVDSAQFSHHTSAFWSDHHEQTRPYQYYQYPATGQVQRHHHQQHQQLYAPHHTQGPLARPYQQLQMYNHPISQQVRPPQFSGHQHSDIHTNNLRLRYCPQGPPLVQPSQHQHVRYPLLHANGPTQVSQNKSAVENQPPQQKPEHFKQFMTPSNNYSHHQFIMPRVPPQSNMPWQSNLPVPHSAAKVTHPSQTALQQPQAEPVAVDDEVWYINGVPHHHARPISQTGKVDERQIAPIVQTSGYQQFCPWSVQGSASDVRLTVPPNVPVFQPPLQMPPPLRHPIHPTFKPHLYAYQNINMHNSITPPPLPTANDKTLVSTLNSNTNNNNNIDSEDSCSPKSSNESTRSSPTDTSCLESSSSCSSLNETDRSNKIATVRLKTKPGRHITVLGTTIRTDVKKVLKRKRKKEIRPGLLKII